MKVILLERVEGRGALGDVVTVKDGFARNFLLPRGKALRANAASMKVFEAQRAELEARNQRAREQAAKSGESLDGTAYILIRQAAQGRRTHAVRTVGDGRAGETHGGRHGRQGGGHLGVALAGQGLGGDHIDRRKGLKPGPSLGSATGDNQFLDLADGFGSLNSAGQEGSRRDGCEESRAIKHGVSR